MEMTINTAVWNDGPKWTQLRPITCALESSVLSSSVDDLGTAGFLSSIQHLTIPQRTPIPSSSFVLKYAVSAEMEQTSDGVVIRSNDLDEEAFGLSTQEAYLEFLTSLRDRYCSLLRREASLSDQDLTILQKLRGFLESQ
jgi:hypothetical protein